jgi:hypothetical protein
MAVPYDLLLLIHPAAPGQSSSVPTAPSSCTCHQLPSHLRLPRGSVTHPLLLSIPLVGWAHVVHVSRVEIAVDPGCSPQPQVALVLPAWCQAGWVMRAVAGCRVCVARMSCIAVRADGTVKRCPTGR